MIKKKLTLAVLSLVMIFCGVCRIALLQPAPAANADEQSTVYTLAFNGGEGACATTGAGKTIALTSGETVEMEFTVDKTMSVESGFSAHPQGWYFDFGIATYDGVNFKSVGSVFTRSGYGGAWFDSNNKRFDTFTPSAMFVEGNRLKVTYKPYYSDEDKGTLTVSVRDVFDASSDYEVLIAVTGLSATQAPTNAGIYMSAGWKLSVDVKDYTIKTSSGTDLGIGYANGSMRVAKKGSEPEVTYNVALTDVSSYFGSSKGVDLSDGEILVMEYDIYSATLSNNNYEMGFSVATGLNSLTTGNRITDDASYCLSLFGNPVGVSNESVYAYIRSKGNAEMTAKFNDGDITLNGTEPFADSFTGIVNPYTLFASGKTLKIEYKPYVSESSKGSLTVYAKGADQEASAYTAVACVSGLDKDCAPKNDVKIFTEVLKNKSWMVNVEFDLQIYDYSVRVEKDSAVTERIGGIACNVNTTITKNEKEDKTVVEHTYHNYTSGYFGNASSFKKTAGKEFAMEFSVLDSHTESGNCWIGFAFGTSIGAHFYTSGDLFYFNTDARPNNGTIVSSDPRCEALWVFQAGYRVKGVLNVEDSTFSVYRKAIGDKEYGDPIAVFKTNATVPDYFNLGMCFQNSVYMEMADIRFSVDGVYKEFSLTGNHYTETDLKTEAIADRVAILTANRKGAATSGSLTYVYDKQISSDKEVSFKVIKGYDMSVKLSESASDFSSAASISLEKYSGYTTFKISVSDGKAVLSGKTLTGTKFDELTSVAFSADKYYFAFYLENDSVYAKTSYIDDFIISDGTDSIVYDFNRGLSEDFTSIAAGRSKAIVNCEWFNVTYYYVDGTVVSVQKVGYGNSAKVPEGLSLADGSLSYALKKSAFIESDTAILLIRDTDELDYYTVTVENGTLSDGTTIKLVKNGETLKAVAPAPGVGYEFIGWYNKGTLVSTESEYNFTVNGAAELEARYAVLKITISVTDGKINGNNVSDTVDYGTTVTILANDAPDEKVFDGWFVGEEKISSERRYSFVAVKNISVTAKYAAKTYTVTVVNGKVNGLTQAVLDFNTSVTVTANEPNEGYVFSHWRIDGAKVSEDSSYSFVLTKDVTVNAVYALKTFTVSVTGGTLSENKERYDYGEEITVVAEAKEGYVFTGWYNGDTLVSEDKEYSFTVKSNVELVAAFSEGTKKESGGNCKSNIGGNAVLIAISFTAAAAVIFAARKVKGGKN